MKFNIKLQNLKELQAAYAQFINAAQAGTGKQLQNAVRTAVNEKSRYVADRLIRTEMSRAWADGFWVQVLNDPDVVAVKYKLSSRHPVFDICDMYARADMFNLGAGIYPKDKVPAVPVHPHCLCRYAEVIDGEVNLKKRRDKTQQAGDKWLRSLPRLQQKQVLGVEGVKEWQANGNWQDHLRGWNGLESPDSRLVAQQAKPLKISKKGTENDFTVNRSVINSEAYREKFEGLPINKNLADALHKEAISILEQRDATAVETMVALDFKTGKKVVSSSSDKEYATSFTRAEMLIFNTYKGKIVLLHNHPLGG